jgi:hypothetical protein
MNVWQAALFSNDSWMRLMNGLRILLTFGAALLLIYEARSVALGRGVSERTKKRIAIAMSALSIGAYFYFFNPNVRYPDYYNRHELFHHYLGAKYANEIGYTRLYPCVAAADTELGRGADVRQRELRDLRTNSIVRSSEAPTECKEHFSAAKWESFKRDVDWFQSTSGGSYWENMQKDHGFNAPPVWILSAKVFAGFGNAGHRFFQVLCTIDIVLLLGMLGSIFWAFGWRVGAIAAVFWGCNAPADFYWSGGAFLRQDWLFLLVLGLCLARKRWFGWAGFCLTWSALVRFFPVIFFAGLAIPIGFHVYRRLRERAPRRSPFQLLHPDHRRLLAGCAVAVSVLVPASIVATRPQVYSEWVERIQVVERTQLTSNMGLETVLNHTWHNRIRFVRDDDLVDPFRVWKETRNQRHARLFWLQVGIAGIVSCWMVCALRKTKLLWLGPPLALPLVVSLTNISCYYYSMFVIAALLVTARRDLGPVLLAAGGASQILMLNFYWVDDKYTAQAWLFCLLAVLLLAGYSRLPLTRLRHRLERPSQRRAERV